MIKIVGDEEKEMEVDGDEHMVGTAGLEDRPMDTLVPQQHCSRTELNMLEGNFQQEELNLPDKRSHGTFKRRTRKLDREEGTVLQPTEKKRMLEEDAPNSGDKHKKIKVLGKEEESMDDLDEFGKAGLQGQSRREK